MKTIAQIKQRILNYEAYKRKHYREGETELYVNSCKIIRVLKWVLGKDYVNGRKHRKEDKNERR